MKDEWELQMSKKDSDSIDKLLEAKAKLSETDELISGSCFVDKHTVTDDGRECECGYFTQAAPPTTPK